MLTLLAVLAAIVFIFLVVANLSYWSERKHMTKEELEEERHDMNVW